MPFDYKNQSLLIIDDEPTNLMVAADFLKNQGIEIMMSKSGDDGIEKAKRNKPDLIMLDVRMPGMDGYETCHQLKRENLTKDIPIVFMTGLSELDDKLKAFAVGAVDYITKPILEPELLARVGVHLQLRNSLKEIEGRNERLVNALDVSNVVNVAIGVFMERHRISHQDAFDSIRSRARSQRRKVDEVAEEILSGLNDLNMWLKD